MRLKDPSVLLTWPAPNYVDPVTRGPILYIVNGIFFGLATIAIWTRIYARIFVRKWFGLDDFLILLGWFSGCGDMALVIWGYDKYWWDRHFWDRKNEFLVPGAKATFAAKMFWTTTSTAIRLSVLVFYYRLLKHVDIPGQRYRWALHLTTSFVVSIYICYIFTTIFACVPVQAYWNWPSLGTCLDEGTSITILSSFNTLSEAIVATLPIPIIFQLKMEPRARWSVMLLLCLGYLVAIVGSVRTVFVYILFNSNDLTWWAAPHWMCSEVEISVAIMCASVPALRPVVGRFLTRRNIIVNEIKKRYQGDSRSSGSATLREVGNSDHLYSYSNSWKDVDIEGIGVDGFGYTVTITGGANLEPNSPKPLRKSMNLGDIEQAEKQDLSLDSHKPTWLKRLSLRTRSSRGSWGSWGLASRVPSAAKPHIEITTRQSLEVIEEVVHVPERSLSGSSFYVDDYPTRPRSWGPSEPQIIRSFYLESDMED